MKANRVAKQIYFVDLKGAGDPAGNTTYYEQQGADEPALLNSMRRAIFCFLQETR